MEVAVQTMTGYGESLRLARWAEEQGLAGFSVADHYLAGSDETRPAYDQLTLLGGIARETSRIQLSTLVSPITFRHPAVMLKAAVTLDELSGGRFTLGVGAGWMEREHEAFGLELPDVADRFDRLEEALGYLRAALDPEAPGFEGRHYRLEPGFSPKPLPENLRLVVGGGGRRRTPTLAGRFADEFNPFPSADHSFPERVEVFREAAVEAGRDPDDVLISTAFPPVVGTDDAHYRENLRQMAGTRGIDPDHLAQRLAELGIPHGPPQQVQEGLAALAEAGIQRVYLQVAFTDLDSVAEAVGVMADQSASAADTQPDTSSTA